MYRRAIRSLLALTTVFLLTTACDKGEEKKADDKKADDKKADDKKADEEKAPEPTPEPEPPQPEPGAEAGADAGAEAGADAGAEAGADAGAEAGAEGGEPTPAAGEGGDDKPEDKPDDKPAEKKPAAAKVDGKPIFEAKCKSCHGLDGKGDTTIGKKVNIPSLAGTKLSKGKVVAAIENGVPDTKMKAFKDKLSKDEIDAVAAYVKKL